MESMEVEGWNTSVDEGFEVVNLQVRAGGERRVHSMLASSWCVCGGGSVRSMLAGSRGPAALQACRCLPPPPHQPPPHPMLRPCR